MRSLILRILAIAAFCATFVSATLAAESRDDAPSPWKHDAELADVYFLDAEHGWAVGDRGVIWSTSDGGRLWSLAKSGVNCRLESVYFADAEHGWIVGGDATPYAHTSRGMVLATTDGGATWTSDSHTNLPRMWKIHIRGKEGFAMGDPSAMFPGGIFLTRDAGRSWSSAGGMAGETPVAWTTGDAMFSGSAAGKVAAAGPGCVAVVAGEGRQAVAKTPDLPLARPRCMKFASATDAWMAGDAGLLLRSDNGGRTWNDARATLPEGAAQFDFRAIEIRGRDIWLAGSPGTIIWHSADGGTTWSAMRTGQSVPLNAMSFADRERGWAAGALGRILSTRDGGQTWRVQSGAAERVAVLGVHARVEDVPLLFYTQTAGNDGYRSATIVMHARHREAESTASTAERRLRDAVASVGGCATEVAAGFPLPDDGDWWSPEALIDAWNQARAGEADAMSAYEGYLVRAIRTWQPEVIVTHDPASVGSRDAMEAFVASMTLRAVDRAADPKAFPLQLSVAGLKPWTVKRVFGAINRSDTGPIELPAAKVAPRLGMSLGERTAAARALIERRYAPMATEVFRPLVDRSPQPTARRDFFGANGRDTSRDDSRDTRRDVDTVAPASLSAVQQRLTSRRNAQALLDRAGRNRQSTLGWLGQLDALTQGLDNDGTAEVVSQLAAVYETSGQWDLAAEAQRVVVQRYAGTSLAPASLMWLVDYETSGEIAHRTRREQGFAVRQASGDSSESKPSGEGTSRIAPLTAILAQYDPRLAIEPALAFPLAVGRRKEMARQQIGRIDSASIFGALTSNAADPAWRSAALAEVWLAAPRGKEPMPTFRVARGDARPYLDGKLDDAIWSNAARIPFGNDGTEMRLACDGEFLYLSAICRRSAGGKKSSAAESPRSDASAKERQRDCDLADADRWELSIDIDRDYRTYYTLAVDERGRTRDQCGRDVAWNPEWYVATRRADDVWYLEAAVAVKELTSTSPGKGATWAAVLRRVQPGVGVTSASGDVAEELTPAAFVWLNFD